MGFELRAHTADVAVFATGETLEDVFASLADGLAAASCDAFPAEGERFPLAVSAESREALLFDFLDELLFQRDVRLEFPIDVQVSITIPEGRGDGVDGSASEDGVDGGSSEDGVDGGSSEDGVDGGADEDAWTLEGSARGVPLDSVDAREVKAVTYSEMRLEERASGWEAYVVFDV
ncbi:archease [Natronobiforma cellulositropha]|uniref:archease n=1 Tax=Natronobiforma cellulositropha TaxID=1679076 RepID=UPI0021D61526|nr:archease [Natronobiforma cellulositropha]